jgi:DNA-directed RNA polymerase subunit L
MIEHSLVSEPVFTVESEKEDPKKLLTEAVERLQKKNKELLTLFKSI